jgi:predicted type IV restriction endonuclease
MGKEPSTLEQGIKALVKKVFPLLDTIQTEEATKTAIIWPLMKILGYDPFDITEVVPEYDAAPGEKKGKKVDTVILLNGHPVMMWEFKWCNEPLQEKDADQLKNYFPFIMGCRLAILTNGKEFRFFSDIQQSNIMDKSPFWQFNLQQPQEIDFEWLELFAKAKFDADLIIERAESTTTKGKMKEGIRSELEDPGPDFVKLLVKNRLGIEQKKIGHILLAKFTKLVREAGAELLELKRAPAPEIISVTEGEPKPRIDEPGKALKAAQQELDKLKSEMLELQARLDGIADLERRSEEHRILQSVLCSILLASGMKVSKDRDHWVSLIDKETSLTLCHVYFDPESSELGIVDDHTPARRVSLSSLTEPPQKINTLLNMLQVGQALGAMRTVHES